MRTKILTYNFHLLILLLIYPLSSYSGMCNKLFSKKRNSTFTISEGSLDPAYGSGILVTQHFPVFNSKEAHLIRQKIIKNTPLGRKSLDIFGEIDAGILKKVIGQNFVDRLQEYVLNAASYLKTQLPINESKRVNIFYAEIRIDGGTKFKEGHIHKNDFMTSTLALLNVGPVAKDNNGDLKKSNEGETLFITDGQRYELNNSNATLPIWHQTPEFSGPRLLVLVSYRLDTGYHSDSPVN